MPHIHTKPGQHDLTTTAFIIRTDGDEAYGLLHRHKKLDMLLPVGGHVELDETPWAAIIHEVREESGYEISQLDILQPQERITRMDGVKIHPVPLFLQTHEFKKDEGHSHVDIGFLFITNQLPAKLPGDGESSDLIWLNAEELDARRHEMPADIAQIYEFSFDIALPRWERVSPETFDV
jgi:8-oxo-dGTP pyrophosphatase MutT (NUDIX family)